MVKWFVAAGLFLGAALAGGAWLLRRDSAAGDALVPPPAPAAAATPSPWQGVASCTASGCHHGNGARGEKGSEYTTWVMYDRHADAYRALLDEPARVMERAYRRLEKVSDAHPETDAVCLDCHAPASAIVGGRGETHRFLEEGVGCEACHGVAQRWRDQHYLDSWKEKDDASKEGHGMHVLTKLTAQAGLCVGCHVGTTGREVDHDLIAAGHRRLNVEFATYLTTMPRHWSAKTERARFPDFEARAWAVGQAVAAQASLELLAQRATRQEPDPHGIPRAWPEFSEYDCFSCHHNLAAPSWRQLRYLEPRTKEGPKQGLFRWGTWYAALLPQALAAGGGTDQRKLATSLETLRQAMRVANPDRALVARLAREAAAELGAWAESRSRGGSLDLDAVGGLLTQITRDGEKLAGSGWDGAAQVYLALSALDQAQRDLRGVPSPRMKGTLEKLNRLLAFPSSPIHFNGPEERSQPTRQEQFRQALAELSP